MTVVLSEIDEATFRMHAYVDGIARQINSLDTAQRIVDAVGGCNSQTSTNELTSAARALVKAGCLEREVTSALELISDITPARIAANEGVRLAWLEGCTVAVTGTCAFRASEWEVTGVDLTTPTADSVIHITFGHGGSGEFTVSGSTWCDTFTARAWSDELGNEMKYIMDYSR